MPSTVTITGLDASAAAGQRVLGPLTDVNVNDTGETIVAALAQGDNTFGVPTGATQVVVYAGGTAVPTASLTFRTNLNPGDSGLPFNQQSPFKYPFPATPPTSILIHASQAQSSPTLSLWFN